jgi:hypothetical protein
MSVLNKLTEGIVNRDLKKEGDALLSKWEKTGLLEGLTSDSGRNGMARLLENQAKQLLKEASSMGAGDVEGFASVAFPLVRRVFGGLLANDLVSVQPMSLPSGLIFFLDFTFSHTRMGVERGESIYGGGVVASGLTGGVSLSGESAEDGFYNLTNAYSSPTASVTVAIHCVASGTIQDNGIPLFHGTSRAGFNGDTAYQVARALRFDPDLTSGSAFAVGRIDVNDLTDSGEEFNRDDLVSVVIPHGDTYARQLRRLTQFDFTTGSNPRNILFVLETTDSSGVSSDHGGANTLGVLLTGTTTAEVPIKDSFTTSTALGSVVGQDTWGLEEPTPGTGEAGSRVGKQAIPEIDIKVDSIAVTAITKKLKAKWSPELGQDLNAYHNLDAEVELTSILSEQIALEIDREILEDLIKGATAGTYYWSRSPGLFVNRTTGTEVGASSAAPDFTGTVSEWYETLIETINDVSAQIHRKTLRGGANFLVTSPEVANILEFTAGFRASVTADADRGTVGAVKAGSISKKWDVYVDPYFPRNLVLVGRKGGSFLESGYVYAPYVPLQVTPTIFGTEDFVPRKGVMTRYAKKMVRPDMYGLVVVRGLIGEAGATS